MISINWLKEELGEDKFNQIKTVTPTKGFYNRKFTGTEDDAKFILDRTKELMDIRNDSILLEFYDDHVIEMGDGTILSTSADIDGRWNSASGTYHQNENNIVIAIERKQLMNPMSLIAVISHELSHYILLGENRIEENDEYLTDLTAIFFGFGIFLGNSSFNKLSSSTDGGSSWSMNTQGYLPEQVIAFATAKLVFERNEELDYKKFTNDTMAKFFKQSMNYITHSSK